MPWCALLTAVKNYNKSLEKLQDFFFKKAETKTKMFKIKNKTKTSWSKTKTIFVLEAPRDQDPGLEDYISDLQEFSVIGYIFIKCALTSVAAVMGRFFGENW